MNDRTLNDRAIIDRAIIDRATKGRASPPLAWARRLQTLALAIALAAACTLIVLLVWRWQATATIDAIAALSSVTQADRGTDTGQAGPSAGGPSGHTATSAAATSAAATSAARTSAAEITNDHARLARGVALARVDHLQAALADFREVEIGASEPLRRAARFNSANLHLRQAVALRQAGEAAQAMALVELAKGLYRQLLVEDPSDWDVRYNLERAVRLLPEEEGDGDDYAPPPENSERAATTMRARSMGLP